MRKFTHHLIICTINIILLLANIQRVSACLYTHTYVLLLSCDEPQTAWPLSGAFPNRGTLPDCLKFPCTAFCQTQRLLPHSRPSRQRAAPRRPPRMEAPSSLTERCTKIRPRLPERPNPSRSAMQVAWHLLCYRPAMCKHRSHIILCILDYVCHAQCQERDRGMVSLQCQMTPVIGFAGSLHRLAA